MGGPLSAIEQRQLSTYAVASAAGQADAMMRPRLPFSLGQLWVDDAEGLLTPQEHLPDMQCQPESSRDDVVSITCSALM